MKKYIKLLALLLTAAMLLSALSGCGSAPQEDTNTPGQATATPAPSATPSAPINEDEPGDTGFRTVTDTIGNEVEVPNEINRIAIISTLPLASVFCMIEGSGEKLVGLTPSSKNTALTSFLVRVAPEIENVSTDFASGDTVNVEEVMNLQPDVVFYNTNNAGDSEAAEQLAALGIPCVGFSPMVSGGNTIETFNAWATLIGQVLGNEVKADEIVSYGREIQDMVSERIAGLEPEQVKSAIILANYTNSAIAAAGKPFGHYWLSAIGAENVAIELETATAPVTLEQIYAWDPDVIFLNSFSPFTAEELMTSSAVEGHDWSGLTAVKNGEVYKMPLGVYYWYPPCSDSPLALQWLAKTLYPELFEDIDMDQVIVDYYRDFYGLELTEADLDTLYNPPPESAY